MSWATDSRTSWENEDKFNVKLVSNNSCVCALQCFIYSEGSERFRRFFLRVMHFGIFKQVQEFILTIPAGSVETTCHIKQAPRHQNDISDRSVWAGNLSASPIGYYFSDTHTHTHTHTHGAEGRINRQSSDDGDFLPCLWRKWVWTSRAFESVFVSFDLWKALCSLLEEPHE